MAIKSQPVRQSRTRNTTAARRRAPASTPQRAQATNGRRAAPSRAGDRLDSGLHKALSGGEPRPARGENVEQLRSGLKENYAEPAAQTPPPPATHDQVPPTTPAQAEAAEHRRGAGGERAMGTSPPAQAEPEDAEHRRKLEETARTSEIPATRAKLEELRTQQGLDKPLDGSGRSIAYIENTNETDHEQMIRDRLGSSDLYGGLTPGAKLHHGRYEGLEDSYLNPSSWMDDKPETLNHSVDLMSSELQRRVSGKLEGIASGRDTYDAVNISQGFSRAQLYDAHGDLLGRKRGDGYEFPGLREHVYGPGADKLSERERREKLAHYVDGRVDRDGSPYRRETERYRALTGRLWDQGTPVVATTANDQQLVRPGYPAGSGMNFLADGKVIRVGAVSNGGTPGRYGDDKVTDFSSQGAPGGILPTLAAEGGTMRIGDLVTVGGTSAAAPLVASTIALMRQVNPNLTSDQIHSILTRTAVDTSAPSYAEGAGVLNPAAAVERALRP